MKPHPNCREPLLTIYDTIFMFGKSSWKRVDWTRTFDPKGLQNTIEKRLARMDKFCAKWGIELRKWTVSEKTGIDEEENKEARNGPRRRPLVYRQFTDAAKHRVDYLLGPVLPESAPREQNILRPRLGPITPELQGSFSGLLRNGHLGQEA